MQRAQVCKAGPRFQGRKLGAEVSRYLGRTRCYQQPERGALARQLLDLGTPEISALECHTPKLTASESA